MTSTTNELTIDFLYRECNDYSEFENRVRVAMKFLLKYIERNDPVWMRRGLLRFVQDRGLNTRQIYNRVRTMAKTIRRRKQEEETPLSPDVLNVGVDSHILELNAHARESPAQLPPWPILSDALDDDVTTHVLSFLDDEAFSTVTKVSWSFYYALAPRQRRVNLSGCESFAEIGLWNFTGVESFSGRINSHLVTDRFIGFLCYDHPKLAHVDLSGCDNLTEQKVAYFVNRMGSRLKSFTMKFLPPPIQHIKKLGEELSKASSLETLSLTLNRDWRRGLDFSCFNGHTSLRELSITVEGAFKLPKDLPHLEVLNLEIIDENPGYFWDYLLQCRYPNLKRVNLTVSSYAYPAFGLEIDMLTRVLSKALELESVVISRLQRHTPLDKTDDLKDRPLSDARSQRMSHFHRRPDFEAEEVKRLIAFCRKRKIHCTCNTND